jgi:hypothetical protein
MPHDASPLLGPCRRRRRVRPTACPLAQNHEGWYATVGLWHTLAKSPNVSRLSRHGWIAPNGQAIVAHIGLTPPQLIVIFCIPPSYFGIPPKRGVTLRRRADACPAPDTGGRLAFRLRKSARAGRSTVPLQLALVRPEKLDGLPVRQICARECARACDDAVASSARQNLVAATSDARCAGRQRRESDRPRHPRG